MSDDFEKRVYCSLDHHRHHEEIRIGRKTRYWRKQFGCPDICCHFCEKKEECGFVCWRCAIEEVPFDAGTKFNCPWVCTLGEKVFGKIFKEEQQDIEVV